MACHKFLDRQSLGGKITLQSKENFLEMKLSFPIWEPLQLLGVLSFNLNFFLLTMLTLQSFSPLE